MDFEILIKTDNLGRHTICGKTGKGKSLIASIIARFYQYPIYMDIDFINVKMTCKEFIERYQLNTGVVLDICNIKNVLVDWETYKWEIPVYYTMQLNRAAIDFSKDRLFRKDYADIKC